ncbi:hypothetical protein GIB67_001667, partial [Kingdonia uniflora]
LNFREAATIFLFTDLKTSLYIFFLSTFPNPTLCLHTLSSFSNPLLILKPLFTDLKAASTSSLSPHSQTQTSFSNPLLILKPSSFSLTFVYRSETVVIMTAWSQ